MENLKINEDVFRIIVRGIEKEKENSIAQNYVIVGEWGAGKTYLSIILYNYLKDKENIFEPIRLDGKKIFSLNDLWKLCVLDLNMDNTENPFRDIMEWEKEKGKRIVLIIDDIQYFFQRLGNEEKYGLRSQLYQNGAPVLVGFSDKVLNDFVDYNAAFYDGLKIIYINPLPENMVPKEAKSYRVKKLMELLPQTIRSWQLSRTIVENSKSEEEDITKLLNSVDDYYKLRFNNLPSISQNILVKMAETTPEVPLAEIRKLVNLDNSQIGPYLKIMTDKSILRKESTTPRKSTYSIADPLFRLWLQQG